MSDETIEPMEPVEASAATPVAPPPGPAPVPATVGAGGWGPPGKTRSWVAVALLTLITCGIYGIVWQYLVFKENKKFSGDGVGGAVGVILAIFLGIVNLFLLPAEVGNIAAKAGRAKPVTGLTGFWNLIPFLGWLIWLAKVQRAINAQWS
ncbi:MAG: DUF4234 domain-containing protein [Actinobacteria bacterium]|nr:DUF4234 domain-containing protein [Actinomycetota bacterium]